MTRLWLERWPAVGARYEKAMRMELKVDDSDGDDEDDGEGDRNQW